MRKQEAKVTLNGQRGDKGQGPQGPIPIIVHFSLLTLKECRCFVVYYEFTVEQTIHTQEIHHQTVVIAPSIFFLFFWHRGEL